MLDIKKHLNRSQHEAVMTIDGPLLVIAGAGSGKTRVIEYRALNLVESNVTPNSILLLTFTKKAAKEMLGRAERHDERCKAVEGGTFHSFAYKILRKYARRIGLSNSFTVLGESEAEEAVHKCVAKLKFTDREKRFPKKDTLKSIISMSINKHISIEEVLKKEYPHFLDYKKEIDALRKEYTEYKVAKEYVDYDDLLVYARFLLQNKNIREQISEKYKYIMVDEYQDTNILQGDITFLLGEAHRNVCVVGDDAQGIYGFRGASHENIMNFPKKFHDCKIIKLEENYRSTQPILDLANATLENMRKHYSKCLVSMREEQGEKPHLVFFKDSYSEAEWIASRIKELYDEGISLRDQGVLFRSVYVSISLQAELSKRGIPYQVFGGLKFYETAHVKDVISHLKVLSNSKDELAWMRILTLIRGIGAVSAEKIIKETIDNNNIETIIKKSFDGHSKGHKYSQGIVRLASALAQATQKNMRLGDIYEIFLDYYKPLLREKFDDWHLRINDLESLKQIISRYESLHEFLVDFTIEPPEKGVRRVEREIRLDEKPLSLSTIHSAKGLEWKIVFLMGITQGLLPVSFSLDDEDDIEEEHRLFYVGITRAKDELYLSMHHEGNRGGLRQFNRISQFLDHPNMMPLLTMDNMSDEDIDEIDLEEDDTDDVTPVYDKKRLLRKLNDFYEKD